jgi:hypothetical protein
MFDYITSGGRSSFRGQKLNIFFHTSTPPNNKYSFSTKSALEGGGPRAVVGVLFLVSRSFYDFFLEEGPYVAEGRCEFDLEFSFVFTKPHTLEPRLDF